MSATAGAPPDWMRAQHYYATHEHYSRNFSKEEQEKVNKIMAEKRDAHENLFLGQVIASAASFIPAGPVGVFVGAIGGAFSSAAMVGTIIMVEKRDAERAIIDEAMEKIFKNVRVEISDILDEHFQEADRFICPINLCLPEDPVVINSPEIKVKKRFFFERTALVDYIARHGYICPKTRITFESKNIQTSLEFYPTIGKMCHKILKEAQRVSRCSLRQLRCLEVMRCICQKQCDTKFLKNRKEVVDKRNANRIGDKSYYGRMSNLMGKFDPSIDDVNSDEEKE